MAHRPIRLDELVDLEAQLHRDKGASIEQLHARDRAIARRIDVTQRDDVALFRAWLAEAVDRRGGSPGQRAARWYESTLAVLALGGLAVGAATVGGWLAMADARPINIVRFWAVLVGVQWLLLIGWIVAVVPGGPVGRVPILRGVRGVLIAISQALPRAVGWVLTKLSAPQRDPWGEARGRWGEVEWLYGGIRRWTLSQLTQVFALTFNLGAVAMFIALLYVSDPAFGWRSALMEPADLKRAGQLVAAPYTWAHPRLTPTLEQIQATRFTSLTVEQLRDVPSDSPLFRAWWPFLLGALVTYGLVPRLVTVGVCQAALRHRWRAVRLDHADFQRLAERLRRVAVETHGEAAEPGTSQDDGPTPRASSAASGPLPPSARGQLLTWSGLGLPADRLAALVRDQLRLDVGRPLTVGGLDTAADEQALARARDGGGGGPVVMIVAAWEPPVGDHEDLLRRGRQAIGEGRPVTVLIVDVDEAGEPTAPDAAVVEQWRRRLGRLGDPWLRVAAACPGTADEENPDG